MVCCSSLKVLIAPIFSQRSAVISLSMQRGCPLRSAPAVSNGSAVPVGGGRKLPQLVGAMNAALLTTSNASSGRFQANQPHDVAPQEWQVAAAAVIHLSKATGRTQSQD